MTTSISSAFRSVKDRFHARAVKTAVHAFVASSPSQEGAALSKPANRLRDLVERFQKSSGDIRSVDQLLGRIRLGEFFKVGKLFMLEDPTGYAYIESQENESGGRTAVVDQVYLSEPRKGAMKRVDAIAEAFARANGCSEIAFFTTRDPNAFKRFLGGDWKFDSYVLKRTLSEPETEAE